MSNETAQSSEVKLCINCHWIATSYLGMEHFKCLAPENKRSEYFNLVNGETIIIYKFPNCMLARNGEATVLPQGYTLHPDLIGCGKEGKWFKEKEYKPSQDVPTGANSMKAAGKKQITVDMI